MDDEVCPSWLSKRSFTRSWSISEDTEVSNVTFENGLLVVTLTRVIPEHHQRNCSGW